MKSSNILLSRDNAAKVADVGLATMTDYFSSSSNTHGTFLYAAPEVLMGRPSTAKVICKMGREVYCEYCCMPLVENNRRTKVSVGIWQPFQSCKVFLQGLLADGHPCLPLQLLFASINLSLRPSETLPLQAVAGPSISATSLPGCTACSHACREPGCLALLQVDSFSFGVVLWELITKEQSQRGNWRPVRVPEECPAEVEQLLRVRRCNDAQPSSMH